MKRMKRKFHFAGAVMVALLVSSASNAQMRGGGPAGGFEAARVAPMRLPTTARVHAAPAVSSSAGGRVPRQATVIQISPNGRVTSSADPLANSFSFSDEIGVPGLGFDYVHLAAVSGNFRFNPPGFGRGERREHNNFVTPIFFGGFPYYSDFPDYQQVQQQPQVIVIQQPAPAVTAQQAAPPTQELNKDVGIPAAAPAPAREVGEFILVRRDGRVLFASAFSVIGAQLQYVTPEGIRRTLPMAELDAVATQDMNEARGTTLQFHN